jgi:hypothetical protein
MCPIASQLAYGPPVNAAAAKLEEQLIDDIAQFTHDPLGHVLYVYPWGEPDSELAKYAGLRRWQRDFLVRLGKRLRDGETGPKEAIQEAVASGHGVGKSALVAWLIKWALDTFEDTRGVVTANTENQLKTKTWAELAKWHRMAINAHWFTYTATSLFSVESKHEKTWRVDMIPWSEHKTEAFAGLHNKGKRIVLIFDESSAIPDPIWEVAEGALTDEETEIIWCVFGNPTRSSGRFRECFGRLRHRWGAPQQIDSEQVEGTNRTQIAQWIEDYGEESDFIRVRVRGRFPKASSLQFIPSDLVAVAMRREARCNLTDPLIMTLDIARGGVDNCVFRFRRGLDARSIPPIRIPGSEAHDSMRIVSKALALIEERAPDAFFLDETGVGGPVGDRLRQLGHVVIGVQFGAASPDPKCANMRSYMYAKGKEWLYAGGAIDNHPIIETDLTSLEFFHDKKDRLVLESKEHMKERGLASTDDGDAWAMTFAFPVAPTEGFGRGRGRGQGKVLVEWDPMAEEVTR